MSGDNAAQIDLWNGRAGTAWTDLGSRMDESLAPMTRVLLQAISARPGERVLEIGCGTGALALRLADAVGATGEVVGVDVSRPMLGLAETRRAGRSNVSFRLADAAEADLGGPYDVVSSRFGVMFFADPVAAFRNIARAMRPGSRLGFVCWKDAAESGWMAEPSRVVRPHLARVSPPPDPEAPGPVAFARRERVESILRDAGFSNVTVEPQRTMVTIGRDVPDALEQMLRIGPTSRALAEESPEVVARATEALRGFLVELSQRGPLELSAAYWLVQATR